MKTHPVIRPIPLLSSAVIIFGPVANAQVAGSWNVDAAGSWATPTNWDSNPAVPGSTPAGGDTANFNFNITAARTITADGVRRVGAMTVGDSNSTHSYTISAGTGGSIVFDSGNAADATLRFTSDINNAVSAPLSLATHLRAFYTGTSITAVNTLSGVISGEGRSITFDNDDGVTPAAPLSGAGQFSLSAANTFTGGITVKDVRVSLANTTAAGAGTVTVQDGGSAFINGAFKLANAFHLTGLGWEEATGRLGALRLGSSASVAGNITLAGTPGNSAGTAPDASIHVVATSSTAISGTIDGSVSGGDLLFGTLSAGTGAPTATGNETLTLSGANSYGDTIVRPYDGPTGGQTMLSIGGAATNTTATLGTGNVYLSGGAGGKTAALRIWRGDGYTLQQDITTISDPGTKTAFFADVTGSGLTLNGRTIAVTDTFRVGSSASGAVLNIDEGSQVTALQIATANAANHSTTVNQTGGTVTVGGELRIAHFPTNTSSWNLSGGTLNLTGAPTGNPYFTTGSNEATVGAGTLYVGIDGQGLFQQSAGTVNAAAVVLDNRSNSIAGANMATGTDEYRLLGGTLNLGFAGSNGDWGIQGNPSSLFTFGGGTLNALTSLPIAVPMAVQGTSSVLDTHGHIISLRSGITGSGTLTLADSSVGQAGEVEFQTTGEMAVSASLAGSRPVAVTGGGRLTLSGANPLTSTITVNASALRITGSHAGGVVLDNSSLTTGGSIGGSLTLASGSTNTIDYIGSPIAIGGSVSAGAGSVNRVNPAAAGTPPAGTFPLMTASSPIPSGTFVIDPALAASYRQSFVLVPAGNQLNLTVTGLPAALSWTGNGTGLATWDVANTVAWAGGEKFYQGDEVTFSDTVMAATGVTASLFTNLPDLDNDLVFTAKTAGASGASISIRYLKPAIPDQVLSVSVSGSDITVHLATDFNGLSDSTAAEVRNAIIATPAANALVNVALAPGEDGSGFVDALPQTYLSLDLLEEITIPADMVLAPGSMTFSGDAVDYEIRSADGGSIGGSTGLLKTGRSKLGVFTTNSFTGDVVIAKGEVSAAAANALGTGSITLGSPATTAADVPTLRLAEGTFTLGNPSITVTEHCESARILSTGGTFANTALTLRSPGRVEVGHPDIFASSAPLFTGLPSIIVEKGTFAPISRLIVPTGTPVTLGTAASGSANTVLEVPKASAADQETLNAAFTLGSLAPGATSQAIFRYVGPGTSGGASTINGTLNLNGRDVFLENTSRTTSVTARLWNFGAAISGTGNVRIRCGANLDGTFDGGQRVRLLSNSNAWNGDLVIEQGQVQLGSGAGSTITVVPNASDVILSAGTSIGVGGSETVDALSGGAAAGGVPAAVISPQLSSSTTTVTLTVGSDNGSGVYDGRLSAGGGRLAFTKTGTGTQTVSGDCTHVGNTTVSAGTLVMNGSNSASPITVSAGATLAGTMVSTATTNAAGTATNGITATAAGATLSPGAPIGTMTAVNVNMATGGVLRIDIDDAGEVKHDKLVATGTLTISNATLTVTGAAAEPVYVIASYATLTGTFGTTNIPAGYQVDYAYHDGESANNIALVKQSDPYLAWLGTYPSMTGANAAPDADFDGDGLANAIEFVIGADPTAATSSTTPGYPAAVVNGGNLVFTFRRTAASQGYPVTVEAGTTLATWPDSFLVPTTNGTLGPVTVAGENVTVTLPLTGNVRRYLRVRTDIPFNP